MMTMMSWKVGLSRAAMIGLVALGSACDKPAEQVPASGQPPATVSQGANQVVASGEASDGSSGEQPDVELTEQERASLKQEAAKAAAGITADNAQEVADALAKEIEEQR